MAADRTSAYQTGGIRVENGEAKMFRPYAAAALLLLLAACGQAPPDREGSSSENATGAVRSITVRNRSQEALLKLEDLERDLTLRRAVRDDGGSCAKIRSSKYQQDYEGMAMWVAHCTGGDWAVYVAPSGTVQARRCADAETLKLPACHPGPVEATGPVETPRWPDPPPAPAPLNNF